MLSSSTLPIACNNYDMAFGDTSGVNNQPVAFGDTGGVNNQPVAYSDTNGVNSATELSPRSGII